MRTWIAVLLLCASATASAVISSYRFDTPEQEARFKRMSEELRCLVCQNQNLADSNAELAQDLRREIHTMILAGQSDDEIIAFMTERYGDFVLYRPPVKGSTMLLWLGPLVLFVVGSLALVLFIRRRAAATGEEPLTADEQAKLQALLHKEQKP